MDATFKATESTKRLRQPIMKAFEELAFAHAQVFLEAGQSEREATSLVAVMMLETAWFVAAIGAITEKAEPDKDKFRAAVEHVLEKVKFELVSTDADR